MRKFTLLAIALLTSVASFAAERSFQTFQKHPFLPTKQALTFSEQPRRLAAAPVIADDDDVLVELPAGVEAEEWTIDGTYTAYAGNSQWQNIPVQKATGVAIVGNDIYVQGLPYFFPSA